MDLVNKFWNYCHTLRHEGVDYSDYIEELTYLIFLKIAEERKIAIPKGCSWNDLIIHEKEELLEKYNKILSELSKEDSILGDIFSQPMAKIRNSSSLKKLLNLIDGVIWSDYNEDVLGAMFEGLLEKAANESKKGAGQYFTPRPLINAIVEVIKPDPFEKPNFRISDVACGTAGFIISSFEWWKKNNKRPLTENEKSKLFNNSYFGQELVVRPRRMAQMNLYLHGIEPNIKLGDTIYEPYNPKIDGTYSCILTNPPFGNRGADQIPDRKDFNIKTSNKQINFIQHVISCLEDGGRAALVLPDNVLTDDKAMELWKHLTSSVNVHTILKLPSGTFIPYANVQAVVVFVQKGKPTSSIWYYDARTNVEGITKRGRPLTDSHFEDFIKSYGEDPNGLESRKIENERFKRFDIDTIESRGFNLDISWLENTKGKDDHQLSAEESVHLAIENMEDMLRDLKEMLNIIEK